MARILDKMKELMFGEYDDEEEDYEDEYGDEDESPQSDATYPNKESVRDIREREYREPVREVRERGEYTSQRERESREVEPVPFRSRSGASTTSYGRGNAQPVSGGRANNRNSPQIYSIKTNVQMQVVIIKPECYEDAQEISNQVKAKKPVVVNLEKLEFPLAQRIMDFLSGTCYSLDGSIQRIANNIFIIAPENVEVSGDFKEELKTKGFNLPWANSGR